MDHLVDMLQDRLREISSEFKRQETNAAQLGSRIQVARPTAQSDAVRLQDLNELRVAFEARVNAQSGNGGGAAEPPFNLVDHLRAHVGFLEAPDGIRFEFTPEVAPALDSEGRPLAWLFHRGAYVHWCEDDPPLSGYWTWTGTQVKMPPADAPLSGTTAFHLALVVLP